MLEMKRCGPSPPCLSRAAIPITTRHETGQCSRGTAEQNVIAIEAQAAWSFST